MSTLSRQTLKAAVPVWQWLWLVSPSAWQADELLRTPYLITQAPHLLPDIKATVEEFLQPPDPMASVHWDLADGHSPVVSSKRGWTGTHAGQKTVESELKAVRKGGGQEPSGAHGYGLAHHSRCILLSRSTPFIWTPLKGKLFSSLNLTLNLMELYLYIYN